MRYFNGIFHLREYERVRNHYPALKRNGSISNPHFKHGTSSDICLKHSRMALMLTYPVRGDVMKVYINQLVHHEAVRCNIYGVSYGLHSIGSLFQRFQTARDTHDVLQ